MILTTLTLGEIHSQLGGDLIGDSSQVIRAILPLESAGPDAISFLSNPKYRKQLTNSKAACVVVGVSARELAIARGAAIVTKDPYLYYARLSQIWKKKQTIGQTVAGIHPQAFVHPQAIVHPTASIGAFSVVEEGAIIGAYTVLKSRVTVSYGCQIGEYCILHPGAVIGADGFGFALNRDPNSLEWVKIEQLGAVRIGNHVEIGANTCVDRGALGDTVIADGVKLDNLIQIGHNAQIGKHSAMAACVGIAGSAKIGAHCTVAGASNVAGHLEVVDHVHVSAVSTVIKSITVPGQYTGFFPIDEHLNWEKNAVALKKLSHLQEQVKILEQRINEVSQS